jgi:hypothetical protein
MPWWMDDMCQKSINMSWVIAHDQTSNKMAHVASVPTSQPSLVSLAKSQT